MMFCSLGHFVMAIIMIVHLIRVRSWIYCNQPLIKLPTPQTQPAIGLFTCKQLNISDYKLPSECIEMNSIYYDHLTLT